MRLLQDHLGRFGGDLFDVHAARGRRHEDRLSLARSSTMPRYNSRSIGSVSSISTRCTMRPSGPVWCVTSVMPRILCGDLARLRGSCATLTPPPLPRPPAWICALTTTLPPSFFGRRLGFFDSMPPRRAAQVRRIGPRWPWPDTREFSWKRLCYYVRKWSGPHQRDGPLTRSPTISCRFSRSCTGLPNVRISAAPKPARRWRRS